jgi:hypothetical protein
MSLFKAEGRGSHVLLVEQHGRNRTDLHTNLGVFVQAGKGGDRIAARHR